MSSSSRSRLRRVSVVAVVAAVAAGGIGTVAAVRREPVVAAPAPVRISSQGTGTSPVTWRVRSTGDGALDLVVGAYQRYLGTVVRLEETPDPADPALPVLATGGRLAEWQRHLTGAARDGASTRGPVTATATVAETGPARVTLRTCTQQAGSSAVSATVVLVRVDAAWKVASARPAAARCR